MKRLTEQEMKAKTEKNIQTHLEANKTKDLLFKSGFWYTISLYSVIWNPETSKHEYRRVEVFLNGLPTFKSVGVIHNFFKELIAYKYYTIWAYNIESEEIILIEGWD